MVSDQAFTATHNVVVVANNSLAMIKNDLTWTLEISFSFGNDVKSSDIEKAVRNIDFTSICVKLWANTGEYAPVIHYPVTCQDDRKCHNINKSMVYPNTCV